MRAKTQGNRERREREGANNIEKHSAQTEHCGRRRADELERPEDLMG